MRVDCSLLCDAVTVRDGLLHVLGGGVTRLWRPEYPAPLGVAMALRVMVHPTEADRPHTFEARLLAEDGKEIARVDIEFGIEGPGNVRPGEDLSAAFAIPVHAVGIPEAGAYSFELLIDGVHQGSVPFVAEVRTDEEHHGT